ncbi:MAG: hypothetical protein SFT94_05815 [Pseudanabaenaceae cyanobacterium bins.68]|nr:hypothetical protein [Pseudanabaenaceae cyanobacterium bins.68]
MPRPVPKLAINLTDGSVAIAFAREAALRLQQELTQLSQTLSQNSGQNSGQNRAKNSLPSLEYQHTGEVFLEIFCNPNIWANAFSAKVLLTLRDQQIRLTTEVELSRLLEDLAQYLEVAE